MSQQNTGQEDTCDVVVGCWPFRRRRQGRGNDIPQTMTTKTTPVPKPSALVNIRREASPLLTACWNQDWDAVLVHLETGQIYHRSHKTGRTALHLATIPGAGCPLPVLRAILRANPYAVVTEDYHQYGGTPLHFCCGSNLRNQPDLCRTMVETALSMHATYREACTIRLSFWSPLFQAARWAAPAATLQILVQASHVQAWIGPWTGAEAWTAQLDRNPAQPHRDSPLYALWRRRAEIFDCVKDSLTLDAIRQVTEDYYLAEDPWQFWCDRFPKRSSLADDDNDKLNPALVHWCKLLVLLRDQATRVSDLLPTVVSLYATIPPLVHLVAVLWPAQVLVPSAETGRLPLHTAVARYLQAADEAAVAFREHSMAIRRQAAQQVVEMVAKAQPQALVVSDPATGLPPAWQVASHATVDLIYTLLRPAPCQLVPVGGYTKE